MGRSALLIGANYPGTKAELRGCINDVWDFQETLTRCMELPRENIAVMIDTDQKYPQPTGKNIKAHLKKMVADAQDGDLLFVHFSGHGTQVPSDDPKEKDGLDEAICPCDMNIITDADLSLIFAPLAEKDVKLTFVADCCHSGTLLDHEEVIITGPKDGSPPPPQANAASMQSMLASLGAGSDKRETKDRALPFGDFKELLSGMMGGKSVDIGNIRSSMNSLFGDDSSAKSMDYSKYIGMAKQAMAMMPKSGGQGGGGKSGMFGSVMSAASSMSGGGGGGSGGGSGGKGGKGGGGMGGLLACCFGGGSSGGGSGSSAGNTGGGSGSANAYVVGSQGKHAYARLEDDVGILLSGCMARETAADAMPPGGEAHGAFSRSLNTIVRQLHEEGKDVTNRNLIIGVRECLSKSEFSQSPCLECSQKWADEPFVQHAQ